MMCHENHTGVLCARCYSRRADCGRAGSGGATRADCPPPTWFERGTDFMYFASIARHCMRCPAGEDAVASYIVTIALITIFVAALIVVVVQRLVSAWKRVKGKKRSDASGIARVFFNWVQMVSMLQSIKMQPPEEVTNAMETAEVINVSIEWFPVQCTLRLTFFHRVLIYMAMPIVAVTIPLIYVYVTSKCTPLLRKQTARSRQLKRRGVKVRGCAKCFFAVVGFLSGDDAAKKAATRFARRRHTGNAELDDEVEALSLEIDVLLDELASAELELTELKWPIPDDAEVEDTEAAAATMLRAAPSGSAEGGASSTALRPLLALPSLQLVESDDDALAIEERAYFEVVSARPLSLRAQPALTAEKLPWVVRKGDVLLSERVERSASEACNFVQITGPWGEGWICEALPDGTELLQTIDRDAMVDPGALPVDAHYRDEVMHCFKAISAMTPEVNDATSPDTIARESIEYVLPAKMKPAARDAFFAQCDRDGDGSVDFAEFVAIYRELRELWRFEDAWAEFQHLDASGDGKLDRGELRALVPQGCSEAELEKWMEQFDGGGKGYLTMADFIAIDSAVQRDMLKLSVGTAFVLCTYFVYSRVTKALLSVFSMEKVEDHFFLKRELGTPALTNEHMGMMAISALYLLIFSFGVPIIGLVCMFYMRHEHGERRFTTMAGFIMDGYRVDVAWFWEFVVLARKLIILCVSLFIWEPFMQSFAAVVVLVISLSIQLYVQPFELAALNLLEIASLASLLTTQLTGILMWYKQLPGNTDGLEFYRTGATVLLFAANGIVIAGFVCVTLWFYLKQKSKHVVQWLPSTLPLFDAIVRVEEELRWPNGTDLLISERHDIREEWTYFAALREARLFGRGAAHAARKKVVKASRKFVRVAEKAAAKITLLTTPADEPDAATLLVPRAPGNAEGGSSGRATPSRAASPPASAINVPSLGGPRRDIVNPLQDALRER